MNLTFSNTVESQSCVYSRTLNRCRCITSVLSDISRHRFLVGSFSLKGDNEIHLIEYDEDKDEVNCVNLYPHKHEIWAISTCPNQNIENPLFFSVFNTGSSMESTLWKMPAEDEKKNELEPIFTLKGFEGKLLNVLWEPNGEMNTIVSLDTSGVTSWDLEYEQKKFNKKSSFNLGRRIDCVGKWDPHNSHSVVVGCSSKILQVDLRETNSSKFSTFVETAHEQRVRDLEFNPFQQYQLMTCGDDCKVKFWDTRKTSQPIMILCGHSHWVNQVKYNPTHDQLVLSCSSDGLVNLWDVPSIASKPVTSEENEENAASTSNASNPNDQNDTLVQSIDEHEESVYGVTWSAKSPWVFASCSYGGRVLVHTCPSTVSSRIMSL